jgi:hypothetical protein
MNQLKISFIALLEPVLNILLQPVISGTIAKPVLVTVALDKLKYEFHGDPRWKFHQLSEKYVPALL